MIDLDTYVDFGSELFGVWQKGTRQLKRALIAAIACVILAITLVVFSKLSILRSNIAEPIAAALGIFAGVIIFAVIAYQRFIQRSADVARIERAERKLDENPQQSQAAWELAQIKLETYLNRNLSQVRSIYWLTVIVMTLGFLLIGYGVFKVFENPTGNLTASIVATASGIIVNFIGLSFLVIYRSTISQAKEYVTILERINAVGMVVQILETIKDDESNLRQHTTAAIATEMLRMYSGTSQRKRDNQNSVRSRS